MLDYLTAFCVFGGFPFGIAGFILSMLGKSKKTVCLGYGLEIAVMVLAVIGVVLLICT